MTIPPEGYIKLEYGEQITQNTLCWSPTDGWTYVDPELHGESNLVPGACFARPAHFVKPVFEIERLLYAVLDARRQAMHAANQAVPILTLDGSGQPVPADGSGQFCSPPAEVIARAAKELSLYFPGNTPNSFEIDDFIIEIYPAWDRRQ